MCFALIAGHFNVTAQTEDSMYVYIFVPKDIQTYQHEMETANSSMEFQLDEDHLMQSKRVKVAYQPNKAHASSIASLRHMSFNEAEINYFHYQNDTLFLQVEMNLDHVFGYEPSQEVVNRVLRLTLLEYSGIEEVIFSTQKESEWEEGQSPQIDNNTDNFYEPYWNYMHVYLVVLDMDSSYYPLQSLMYEISESAIIEIDTGTRCFDAARNLLCLPEDDDDDLYAGEYYPRRFVSSFLSIEYLDYYVEPAPSGVMFLLGGIYDSKASALKRVNYLKTFYADAHIIETALYQGCMH